MKNRPCSMTNSARFQAPKGVKYPRKLPAKAVGDIFLLPRQAAEKIPRSYTRFPFTIITVLAFRQAQITWRKP